MLCVGEVYESCVAGKNPRQHVSHDDRKEGVEKELLGKYLVVRVYGLERGEEKTCTQIASFHQIRQMS